MILKEEISLLCPNCEANLGELAEKHGFGVFRFNRSWLYICFYCNHQFTKFLRNLKIKETNN